MVRRGARKSARPNTTHKPKSVVLVTPKTPLLLLALATACLPASAQLFDNLSQPNIPADTFIGHKTLFQSFSTPNTLEKLSEVRMSLTYDLDLYRRGATGNEPLAVLLYSDSAKKPGTLVASLGSILPTSITGTEIVTVSLTSQPELDANSRYWIGLQTPTDFPPIYLSASKTFAGVGAASEFAFIQDKDGSSGYRSFVYTMKVDSTTLPPRTAVPDAGPTSALMALGLTGVIALRRRLAR